MIKKIISNIFNEFKESKDFDKKIEIRKSHFRNIVKTENTLYLYFYLVKKLFLFIIKLESLIKNIINCNFFQLYNDFNIDLLGIKTDLSFFKSFAINFSILEETNQLNIKRQNAINPHKDIMNYLYNFCVIVIFEDFEEENIILSEIGIIIEIEDGYIIILKSAFLEYFNLHILKNRFSIVFYLRKTFYSEI